LVKLWVFQTDYDEIELKKSVMTSFQRHHRYYVTKLTSRSFSILGLSQSKIWLRQWFVLCQTVFSLRCKIEIFLRRGKLFIS